MGSRGMRMQEGKCAERRESTGILCYPKDWMSEQCEIIWFVYLFSKYLLSTYYVLGNTVMSKPAALWLRSLF